MPKATIACYNNTYHILSPALPSPPQQQQSSILVSLSPRHAFAPSSPIIPSSTPFESAESAVLLNDIVLAVLSLLFISLLSSLVYDVFLRSRRDGAYPAAALTAAAALHSVERCRFRMRYLRVSKPRRRSSRPARDVEDVVGCSGIGSADGRNHGECDGVEAPSISLASSTALKVSGDGGGFAWALESDAGSGAGGEGTSRGQNGAGGAHAHCRMPDKESEAAAHVWWVGASVVALTAAVTFAAEVSLIVATQRAWARTQGLSLGFAAVSPLLTDVHVADQFRRTAMERPCVTPVLDDGWTVMVQTCLVGSFRENSSEDSGVAMLKKAYKGRVRFTSHYHSRGSDHFVRALDPPEGDGALYNLSLSARTKFYRRWGGPFEIVRMPRAEDGALALALHLHAWTFPESPEGCGMGIDGGGEDRVVPLDLNYNHTKRRKVTAIAQMLAKPLVEEVDEYETDFPVNTEDLSQWLHVAMGAAAGSMGLRVTDTPVYVDGKTNKTVEYPGNVYRRSVRSMTVPSLLVLLSAMAVVKVLARWLLKPLLLHEVALLEDVRHFEMEGVEHLSSRAKDGRKETLDESDYMDSSIGNSLRDEQSQVNLGVGANEDLEAAPCSLGSYEEALGVYTENTRTGEGGS